MLLPWQHGRQHVKGFCSSRSHHPDEEVVSSLLSQPKRQKQDASCIEEELLSYTYHLVSERGKEERATLGQN